MITMKKIAQAFLIVIAIVTMTAPSFALAQSPGTTFNPANRIPNDSPLGSSDVTQKDAQNQPPSAKSFQIVTCTGVKDPRGSKGVPEVECDYGQLLATASRIIQFALYILIPIVLCMIIFIGFEFVTAGGDSSKLERAKRMIKPMVIGLFLIFSAWILVYTVLNKLIPDKATGINKANIIPASIK
jgi:hypothetical protein